MLMGKNIRLALREREDAALMREWTNDPEFWGPYYNVWSSTLAEWESALEQEQGLDAMTFLVRAREDDRPVGQIGYDHPFRAKDFYRSLEIWYQIHPSERRKGYATQAAAILVDHLFASLPVERIHATAVVGNDASCAVLERAGLQREGVMRSIFFVNGRFEDMHLYSIVRGDWSSQAEYQARFDFF
jgi:ribosomal-protein-alanine N-acetyltransferase